MRHIKLAQRLFPVISTSHDHLELIRRIGPSEQYAGRIARHLGNFLVDVSDAFHNLLLGIVQKVLNLHSQVIQLPIDFILSILGIVLPPVIFYGIPEDVENLQRV